MAFSFYSDLKADGYVTFNKSFQSDKAKAERDKILRFFRIAMNVSNKLANTKEFDPEEQWFILLPLYCWYSEMIKNLLFEEAKKIHRSLDGKDWKGFMTLGNFLTEISRYKNGRHKSLFSYLDVDLRNCVDHANIGFNSEIIYYDREGNQKSLKPEQMISLFKKIAPLYATLFVCRSRIFLSELKILAKEKGYL